MTCCWGDSILETLSSACGGEWHRGQWDAARLRMCPIIFYILKSCEGNLILLGSSFFQAATSSALLRRSTVLGVTMTSLLQPRIGASGDGQGGGASTVQMTSQLCNRFQGRGVGGATGVQSGLHICSLQNRGVFASQTLFTSCITGFVMLQPGLSSNYKLEHHYNSLMHAALKGLTQCGMHLTLTWPCGLQLVPNTSCLFPVVLCLPKHEDIMIGFWILHVY